MSAQANGSAVNATLINSRSYTLYNSYTRTAAPIPLAQGQAVLLTAAHINTVGVGFLQVGVRISSTTPRWEGGGLGIVGQGCFPLVLGSGLTHTLADARC